MKEHLFIYAFLRLIKYNGTSQNKIIAFDPGVRTFCIGYDPDDIVIKLRK